MDNNEFVRLADKYIDTVYRVAVSSAKNCADADDIVQNTFMKLLAHTGQFNNDEHAKRWLIRVAVNESRYIFRKRARENTVPLEEIALEEAGFTSEESGLFLAVMQLPAEYRQIVHLFYFEDYSTREIAEIVGMSEANVRKRLQRARNRLKDILEEV